MYETWVGGFGRSVEFDIAYAHDGARGGTGINFNKSLTNNTNFFWSSFQIVLTPMLGSTISNVTASPNVAFSDVSVAAGGGGSWVLLWDQDMGTGVSTGGGAAFSFGFDIDGNLGFMMKQTPLPTPAGAALLGVAGLWGARRRRI
jgi:MYXO-CTERM domain-containing protein